MYGYNNIVIGPVNSLEVGDFFSMPFLSGIVSGKITGVPFSKRDLTPEQRAYMVEHKLDIPDNEWAMLTSPGERLLFGDFVDTGSRRVDSKHMYVNGFVNVAVFSNGA